MYFSYRKPNAEKFWQAIYQGTNTATWFSQRPPVHYQQPQAEEFKDQQIGGAVMDDEFDLNELPF